MLSTFPGAYPTGVYRCGFHRCKALYLVDILQASNLVIPVGAKHEWGLTKNRSRLFSSPVPSGVFVCVVTIRVPVGVAIGFWPAVCVIGSDHCVADRHRCGSRIGLDSTSNTAAGAWCLFPRGVVNLHSPSSGVGDGPGRVWSVGGGAPR